jgi:cell wall-associated NlpC family hydrolase
VRACAIVGARVKRGVVVAGSVGLLVPLLFLGLPVLGAVVAEADSASCASGGPQAVDVAAVSREVAAILVGRSAGGVSVVDDPAQQIPNARTIVATGVALGMPPRGQVVALATALQESGLVNLASGDRDSLGLFQQRPSQGWGTAAQIMDPVYASTSFYKRLLAVAGWQQMTVAEAAQAVQQSAFPDAYAKWEPLATALQQAVASTLGSVSAGPGSPAGSAGGGSSAGSCADGSGFGPIPPGAVPAGYSIPMSAPEQVKVAIRWAMGQLGTPYQWGGSCTAAHGSDPMGRCDCSSLVQQAYAAAGVHLGRTTYVQVTEGTPVMVDALRPGDLVFTAGSDGTAANPGHVGIFMGEGLIINAPHTGAVVSVESLASWRPQIVAARRVVNP